MGSAHLHSICRDAPHFGFKIELPPGGATKFARTNEREQQQPNGDCGLRVPSVARQFAEQICNLTALEVVVIGRTCALDSTFKRVRGVVLYQALRDGVSEHSRAPLLQKCWKRFEVIGFFLTLSRPSQPLHSCEHSLEFVRLDRVYATVTELRIDVVLEAVFDLSRVVRRPLRSAPFDPLLRNRPKGVGHRLLALLLNV